jgi:hypothetical protein
MTSRSHRSEKKEKKKDKEGACRVALCTEHGPAWPLCTGRARLRAWLGRLAWSFFFSFSYFLISFVEKILDI